MESLEIVEEWFEIKEYFNLKGLELLGSKDTVEGKVYLVRKKPSLVNPTIHQRKLGKKEKS